MNPNRSRPLTSNPPPRVQYATWERTGTTMFEDGPDRFYEAQEYDDTINSIARSNDQHLLPSMNTEFFHGYPETIWEDREMSEPEDQDIMMEELLGEPNPNVIGQYDAGGADYHNSYAISGNDDRSFPRGEFGNPGENSVGPQAIAHQPESIPAARVPLSDFGGEIMRPELYDRMTQYERDLIDSPNHEQNAPLQQYSSLDAFQTQPPIEQPPQQTFLPVVGTGGSSRHTRQQPHVHNEFYQRPPGPTPVSAIPGTRGSYQQTLQRLPVPRSRDNNSMRRYPNQGRRHPYVGPVGPERPQHPGMGPPPPQYSEPRPEPFAQPHPGSRWHADMVPTMAAPSQPLVGTSSGGVQLLDRGAINVGPSFGSTAHGSNNVTFGNNNQ